MSARQLFLFPQFNSNTRISQTIGETPEISVPHAVPALSHTREAALNLLAKAPTVSMASIERRYALQPQASAGDRLPKRTPKNLVTKSNAKDAADGIVAKASNGSPEDILGVLYCALRKLIETQTPGHAIMFSKKGLPVYFKPENAPKDSSFDEHETLSDDFLNVLLPAMPDSDERLADIAEDLLNKLGHDIAMADDKGHIYCLDLPNAPADKDPASFLYDLMFGEESDKIETQTKHFAPGEKNEPSVEIPDKEYTIEELFGFFNGLFLPESVENAAWRSFGIKDMILYRDRNMLDMHNAGEIKIPNGAILNGLQGTGKSETAECTKKLWKACGGHVATLMLGDLEQPWAGSFSNTLLECIDHAIKEARKRGKPSLVYIDEASNLVTAVPAGESTSRYYQGALDTLKHFTTAGYPELVFVLTTNADKLLIDGPLVRSLRLELITFSFPKAEALEQMFAHYLKSNDVTNALTVEQLRLLTMAVKDPLPADVRKFAEEYHDRLIMREYAARGLKTERQITMDIVTGGKRITNADVKSKITFDSILEELKVFAEELQGKKPGTRKIGY